MLRHGKYGQPALLVKNNNEKEAQISEESISRRELKFSAFN
jgi:hypothetical protein